MENNSILINTQTAIFFAQPLNKPEEIWVGLNNVFDGIFHTPIMLPVPNEPPLYEVPIIQMSSGNFNINIARARIDLYLTGVGNQKFSDVKSDLIEKVSKIINLLSSKGVVSKRIGFVSRFFIENELQDVAISQIIKKSPLEIQGGDSIHEVFIKFVTRDKIIDFEINNFTTIERFFARIVGSTDKKKGVLITRDFNTIPEKEYSMTTELIKSFIDEAETKFQIDKILELWEQKI